MKNLKVSRKAVYIVAFLAITVTVLASVTKLSRARTQTISITVVNNSSRDIRHLYLSPADSDNWGPDQLNNSAVTPNHSFTVSNASCDQANIKVIAEDQDGCFLYQIVSCSGDTTWTIANDATRDCGN